MTALLADALDEDLTRQAYVDLRSARRKNRIQNLDYFDAFYKAYVTAIFSAVGIYAAAGAFGDDPLTAAQLADLQSKGPAWLGLLVAVAVAIGLRSGGRGGPMAFERADVRHVLMAPVDRRQSIRRPFLRQLRYALFLGVTVGAAAGLVASRRMPDAPVAWVACAALFGGALAVVAFAGAAVVSGFRLKVWMAELLSVLVLAWSAADVIGGYETSPFTFLGYVATWPLEFEPLAFIGIAVSLLVAAWGTGVVNRSSIEAAERRSRLVGQLRFAATLQDVRTVMVLQRQLSQEQIRQRPWIRLPRRKKPGFAKGRVHRRVFIKRGVQGLLRWPALRLIRLLAFSAIAGFAGLGAWMGTSPLIVVGGLALWMAALDLCEPLAQEIDHPDRLRASPHQTGIIYLQHLFVPGVVLFGLTLLAFVPAFVFGNSSIATTLLPQSLFAAATALAGASLAVNARPPGTSGMVDTPETASIKFVWRVLVPPALGVVGFIPLVTAQRSWEEHHSQALMVGAMNLPTLGCLFVTTAAFAWLRFGDQFRESLAAQQAEAAKASSEKKSEKSNNKDKKLPETSKKSTAEKKAAGTAAAKARNKATKNKRKKR